MQPRGFFPSKEAAKQDERLQLLSFCHPLCGLRDRLYLLTRVASFPGQFRHGAARLLLPPDLLL